MRIRESICSYESFGVSERGSECVDGWMDGWTGGLCVCGGVERKVLHVCVCVYKSSINMQKKPTGHFIMHAMKTRKTIHLTLTRKYCTRIHLFIFGIVMVSSQDI